MWCRARLLHELRKDHKARDESTDDEGRTGVEVVDLGAKLQSEVDVLNLLQPRAIDVPNAALPDVS